MATHILILDQSPELLELFQSLLVLQLELGRIEGEPTLVMTGLSYRLMMTAKERPGQSVRGCDHLLPEKLPDHVKYFWQGVGDQPTTNPLRHLKCCKLLGPDLGSRAFFSCSAFA